MLLDSNKKLRTTMQVSDVAVSGFLIEQLVVKVSQTIESDFLNEKQKNEKLQSYVSWGKKGPKQQIKKKTKKRNEKQKKIWEKSPQDTYFIKDIDLETSKYIS